jgi:diacylglycerol kinase (ATP)
MQTIKLIHNPTAGDEEHKEEKLMKQIENAGFVCRYSSTKKEGWKEIEDDVDMIAVAGGDGTVRKVIKQLLKRNGQQKHLPIGLLALGTANNIAKTFDVNKDTEDVISSWKNGKIKKVDIGLVKNVPGLEFFFEGFGFGIFPYLMKAMKEAGEEYDSPEEELKAALKKTHELLQSYEPRQCHLEVDGTDHSGKFFMVEVMNIRSIGPNVELAPMADPGDGEFEVVLIPEAHKEKFGEYILKKIDNSKEVYHFHTLKGKKIAIRWDGTRVHGDDEMLKIEKGTEVVVELKESVLHFLVPNEPANS